MRLDELTKEEIADYVVEQDRYIKELEAGCDRLHGFIAEKDTRIEELEAEVERLEGHVEGLQYKCARGWLSPVDSDALQAENAKLRRALE